MNFSLSYLDDVRGVSFRTRACRVITVRLVAHQYHLCGVRSIGMYENFPSLLRVIFFSLYSYFTLFISTSSFPRRYFHYLILNPLYEQWSLSLVNLLENISRPSASTRPYLNLQVTPSSQP
jgi:hypothetical protein